MDFRSNIFAVQGQGAYMLCIFILRAKDILEKLLKKLQKILKKLQKILKKTAKD